ncbi:MAG: hypothetical protein HQL31_01955 [Planctomycetes bacterium]|nr:hypothetical protein [Planctomycetota bacterium]
METSPGTLQNFEGKEGWPKDSEKYKTQYMGTTGIKQLTSSVEIEAQQVACPLTFWIYLPMNRVFIAFILAFSAVFAATPSGLKVYSRIGDAPKEADLYECLEEPGTFIDANSIPKEYRTRFSMNTD